MKLLVIVLVLLALGVGLRLAIPRMGSSVAGGVTERDGKQGLADCPGTPNCATDEWPVTGDAATAMDTLVSMVGEQAGAQIVSRENRYLHATFSTPLMGYVDDVEFLLRDDGTSGSPVVLVRSASRLGKSDLGANARRIGTLRSAVSGKL